MIIFFNASKLFRKNFSFLITNENYEVEFSLLYEILFFKISISSSNGFLEFASSSRFRAPIPPPLDPLPPSRLARLSLFLFALLLFKVLKILERRRGKNGMKVPDDFRGNKQPNISNLRKTWGLKNIRGGAEGNQKSKSRKKIKKESVM